MTTTLTTQGNVAVAQIEDSSLLSLITEGDCSKLTDAQKLAYYKARCDAAGLDYRAQPFQFMKLNGKLMLYAPKACSDQLTAKHGIKAHILSQETTADGLRIVTVRATARDGRETDEIGAVSVKALTGEALANAMMKAATKAKRRAILSVCGLGMMDETEIESIPKATPVRFKVDDDGAVFDGVTGEVISIKKAADETLEADLRASVQPEGLRDTLLAAINAGFDSEFHHRNWGKKHAAEIQSLPKQYQDELRAAFANAGPKAT